VKERIEVHMCLLRVSGSAPGFEPNWYLSAARAYEKCRAMRGFNTIADSGLIAAPDRTLTGR